MLRFPRETVEFLPVTVTVLDDEGDPVPDPTVEISVVVQGDRPEDWTDTPYLIDGLDPAVYDAYIRVTDVPETPVVLAGRFQVT